jgi:sacsin
MKDVECGIAALVPESDTYSLPVPKFFSIVSLPFPSELPVHVHATFLINEDRKSMRDAGAEWNRWLLTRTIPRLYLAFLEDLGRKIEKDRYFTFWPQNQPQRGSLSELIFSSFWKLLPESRCRLFPVAPN